MSTAAVEINGLTKEFPSGRRGLKVRAVDNLTLRIGEGQIYGLLGPNGSGKSTALKIILGLHAPSAGGCRVFGVPGGRVEARAEVGYLPEAPYFYRYLTGFELVCFYARICGVPRARLAERAREVIAWVGLGGAAERRVGTYSKGMLQRIGLAQALVHDPRLLILDEPTAGVDPAGSAAMAELILQLKARGKTVLLCSHLLGQVEEICDRVAILHRGRLVLEGAVGDLVNRPDRQALIVGPLAAAQQEELGAWLAARGSRLFGVERPRAELDRLFLERVVGVTAGENETLPPRRI